MYVRDAKNRDEAWLLDHIEAMGLDDTAFRSRDYVIAVDEDSGAKAGFGRIRLHKGEPADERPSGRRDRTEEILELTSIGVLEGWRGQGVGAHVIERLVGYADDDGFERVYALTDEPGYLAQFGFESIPEEDLPEVLRDRLAEKRDRLAPDAVPLSLSVEAFVMPERLRERFKRAAADESDDDDTDPDEFGIDTDSATYKYDTGR